MRVLFWGTSSFSLPSLRALLGEGFEVVAVVTQPDRPVGRSRSKVAAPPVKECAEAEQIPVLQPERPRGNEFMAELRALEPDISVVISYGHILTPDVIELAPQGTINVHASLLPKLRGASPIQEAVRQGLVETGVTIMQMEAGLDTGPVLLRRRTPIRRDDTGGSLHDRLAALGAELLAEGLRRTLAGETLVATPQPADGVTYAHKLDKAEAKLDFRRPAIELERQVRAFDPWPVAEAEIAGESLRIWAARAIEVDHHAAPASVLAAGREGIDVACGSGALRITAVQRAGGKRIGATDYLNARPDLRPRP